MGRNIPEARLSIRLLLLQRRVGSKAILGEICCGVSVPGRRMLLLQRQFHLAEKLGLCFRAEFFNLFNHHNFGNPINVLNSPLFGQSTQTLASNLGSGGADGGFNPLYQIGGPRSIQLALKFEF
jgi:hypothetical protein